MIFSIYLFKINIDIKFYTKFYEMENNFNKDYKISSRK